MNKAKANELIKVTYTADQQPTVSGRELHEALGVETRYNDWFKRMSEYGFTEGVDFYSILSKNPEGGRPSTDHELSIPMAKEICMIQRSEKGKQFRQYFIEIENRWNTPEAVMARALQMANRTIDKIKNANMLLEQKIEQDKPLVDFANQVSSTSDLIDMNEMAKLLKSEHINIGRNKLFCWLRKHQMLMKNNLPYQKYIDGNYFRVKEVTVNTPFGTKVYTKTYVTGKGQIYITEKLKAENVGIA